MQSPFLQRKNPIFLIEKVKRCSLTQENNSLFVKFHLTNQKNESTRKSSDTCSIETNSSFYEGTLDFPKITTNFFKDFTKYNQYHFNFHSSLFTN